MYRKLDMLAALGGLLYPLLAIGGIFLAMPALPPDSEAPPAEIAAHVVAHPVTATTAVGLALEFTGLLMLMIFGHRLAAWLGGDWASRSTAALAGLAATLKIASFSPVIIAFWFAQGLTADTLAALFRLNDGFVPLSEAAVFAFVLLAGYLILASGRLPRWLGWYAVLSAILAIADLFAQTAILELPALLWLSVTSVVLVRATRGETPSLQGRAVAQI
jgi:hypothetical protein